MAAPSLGLIMILKDEESNLPRSLLPLVGCFDEMVVVDTGSLDATPRICAQAGARVHEFKWVDDFAAARNYSIAMSRSDWLFWLDGDNAVEPAQLGGLREMIPAEGPAVLWATEHVELTGERLWQKRCFPNHPQVRFKGRVHEQLVHPPDWPARLTPLVVRHWGYSDPDQVARHGTYYLELLKRMLDDDPDDYYAHFQAARCYQNLRSFDLASKHWARMLKSEKALDKNPVLWAYAGAQWIRMLLNMGRAEQATAELNRLLEQAPDSGLLHYEEGRLHYAQKRHAEALAAFSRALELGFGVPVVDMDLEKIRFLAHYYRARSAMELKRPQEAIVDYEMAITLDPSHLAARTELARLLLDLGRPLEARGHLALVLKERPQDRGAQRLLQRIEVS